LVEQAAAPPAATVDEVGRAVHSQGPNAWWRSRNGG
jgi:hypothetical protein